MHNEDWIEKSAFIVFVSNSEQMYLICSEYKAVLLWSTAMKQNITTLYCLIVITIKLSTHYP